MNQNWLRYQPPVRNGSESDAANAALCAADQGKFWIFSDYLWANQQNEQAGEFSRDRLIEIVPVTDGAT